MTFEVLISISDITSILSLIGVAIGGIFALYQYKKAVSLKRADYINELTERLRNDIDISDSIYMLDYSKKWYNENFHNSGEKERKLDKTLSYFSYICYL